jgi:RND family efflux transporter MFP subunit
MNRTALRVTAIAFLAAVGGCERRVETPSEARADTRPLVEVVPVVAASRAGDVTASGLVGHKREVELSFDAPGVIESLRVDTGDRVRSGDVLATLRRTTVGSNATEAALARETATRLLARTRALHERGFASKAELEDAELAVERANESTRLVAPADGVILRRFAESSQTTSAGVPVLLLGESASGMVVRASVAAAHAARVHPGNAVVAEIVGASSHDGRVMRVAAKSDDVTGAFEVEIAIDHPEGLRSGQVARVRIAAAGAGEPALLVPTLSLLDARADQGVVFVVDEEGVARRRSVQTAGIRGDRVVVIAGLSLSDRVVASGVAYVRDGEAVRIVRSG